MFACIIRDIIDIVQFLPLSILVGFACFCMCYCVRKYRRTSDHHFFLLDVWYAFLGAYLVMLSQIVFFSREAGSRVNLNLVIGGTWTADAQGRAYVIENILLFIPFGVLVTLCQRKIPLVVVVFVGFMLSLGIECLQLITGRGYFQVDDLIMNTIGCLLGAGVMKIIQIRNRCRRKQ